MMLLRLCHKYIVLFYSVYTQSLGPNECRTQYSLELVYIMQYVLYAL